MYHSRTINLDIGRYQAYLHPKEVSGKADHPNTLHPLVFPCQMKGHRMFVVWHLFDNKAWMRVSLLPRLV